MTAERETVLAAARLASQLTGGLAWYASAG
jgi:hypothetical protein